MTKSELIERIVGRHTDVHPRNVKYSVRIILNAMALRLRQGRQIKIRQFGSFGLTFRAPRLARNPKSGEQVTLPGRYVPHFKTGLALRKGVRDWATQAARQVR